MIRRILPFILILMLAAPVVAHATDAQMDPDGAKSTTSGEAPENASVDQGVSAPLSVPMSTPVSPSLLDWLWALWSFVVPLA